jgi:peroxiredoxin
MNNLSAIALSLLLSAIGLSTQASVDYDKFPLDPAIYAPDFSLPGVTDKEIKLSDYKGKIILLNFWATFCVPCRLEMPSLQALSEKYHNKDLEIIAISVDHGREKSVKKWIAKNNLDFPIALEGQDAGSAYEVSALPVTFIIGKQGQLIGRILGEREWNSEETTLLIESLLAKEETPQR